MTNKQAKDHIDAQIAKAEADMASLKVRIATLKEVRANLNGSKRNDDSEASGTAGPVGPSKAIRDLVAAEPGIEPDSIVERLNGQIKTRSRNQERLLRNTLANMLRDGVLAKDQNGALFMGEQAVR